MLPRLYIIEGLVTVVWAGCCVFLVPKNYETAYFLTDEDKALMRKRAEEMEAYSGGTGHYGKQEIKQAAKDVKSWMHGVIQIAVVTILYGNKPNFIRTSKLANMCGKGLAHSYLSLSSRGFNTLPSRRSTWSSQSIYGVQWYMLLEPFYPTNIRRASFP